MEQEEHVIQEELMNHHVEHQQWKHQPEDQLQHQPF